MRALKNFKMTHFGGNLRSVWTVSYGLQVSDTTKCRSFLWSGRPFSAHNVHQHLFRVFLLFDKANCFPFASAKRRPFAKPTVTFSFHKHEKQQQKCPHSKHTSVHTHFNGCHFLYRSAQTRTHQVILSSKLNLWHLECLAGNLPSATLTPPSPYALHYVTHNFG